MAEVPTRLQHDRQHRIYRLALERGSVEVGALAEQFGVTTETIRRDLSELQETGKLRRVHGGAIPAERLHHEPTVEGRETLWAAEKLLLAEAVIDEIPRSGTVMIDSGSTLSRLAAVFPTDRDVHVITNSLEIGLTLARRGVEPLTLIGGEVRIATYAAVDPRGIDEVRGMRVDQLFISCDGLSLERGLTTPYSNEAAIKRAMVESARRVIAMADHSKLGNDQLYPYAALDELDAIVTDHLADPADIERLRELDVDVRVAGP